MGPVIDPVFARVLEASRDRCNALFFQARRDYPKLDGQAVLHFLSHEMNGLISAVAKCGEQYLQAATEAFYEATLTLMGKCLIGPDSRHAEFQSLWLRLMSSSIPVVARFPSELIPDLTNGLYNLITTPRCRPANWCELMAIAAKTCSCPEQIRTAGLIAAWMCGMAHYRSAALQRVSTLPESTFDRFLACTTRGTPGTAGQGLASNSIDLDHANVAAPKLFPRWIEKMAVDPWFVPSIVRQPGLQIVAEIGGFRGIGAEFVRPPQVAALDGSLYANDGETCWLICADAFGTTFHRWPGKLPKAGRAGRYQLHRNGTVSGPRAKRVFSMLAGSSSSASTDTTLAVTLPHSHRVFLVSEGSDD